MKHEINTDAAAGAAASAAAPVFTTVFDFDFVTLVLHVWVAVSNMSS